MDHNWKLFFDRCPFVKNHHLQVPPHAFDTQDDDVALDILDTSCDSWLDRAADLLYVYSSPSTPMLPLLECVWFSSGRINILTKADVAMKPLTLCIQSIPTRKLLLILSNLYAAVATMHCRFIAHGNLHESSIFVTGNGSEHVLRGFNVDIQGSRNHVSFNTNASKDTKALIDITDRLLLRQRGVRINEIVKNLLCKDITKAIAAVYDIISSDDTFIRKCIDTERQNLRFNTFQRHQIINTPVPRTGSHADFLEAVSFGVLSALSASTPTICMFTYACEPGMGIGPCTEVLQQYFDILRSNDLLSLVTRDGGGDDMLWPTTPQSAHMHKWVREFPVKFYGLPFFCVTGWMVGLSLSLDLNVFVGLSPVVLCMMLAAQEEAQTDECYFGSANAIVHNHHSEISDMISGGSVFSKFILESGWNSSSMIENYQQKLTLQRGTYVLSDLRELFVFERETMRADEISVFLRWIATTDSEKSKKFLKLVLGTEFISAYDTRITISIKDNGEDMVSSCQHHLILTRHSFADVDTLDGVLQDMMNQLVGIHNSI